MSHFKRSWLFFTALLLLGEFQICSQQLLNAPDTFRTVIISASRFDQLREQLPVSVTTISNDELQRKNLSVDRAIERTAGVAVIDGEIQIRGSSGWSYGAGSRVAVIFDGLPLLSGDALRPSWGLMPNESIGQVDLMKGPASVQYGSAALSGVLHAQTMWPTTKPFTRINLTHGGYSDPQTIEAKYWHGSLMESAFNFLHTRKVNNWDLVLSSSMRLSDGYLGPMADTINGTYQNKYNPFTVDKYDASKNVRARVAARYHFEDIEGLTIGAAVLSRFAESVSSLLWANDTTGLYQSYTGATTPGRQFFLMSDVWTDYRVSPMVKHQFKYRWLHVDNGFEKNQDSYNNNHTIDFSSLLRLDSIGLKGLKMIPGIYSSQVQSLGSLYSALDTLGKNTSSNYAAFLQIEKVLWDKLHLSFGGRYEELKLNNEHFSKPVWRFGVNFEWNAKTYLRANYGQGFRFPTIAERYTRTNAGDFFIHPNPQLQPESSESYEVGIIKKWQIGKVNFDIDVTLFRQLFKNYIEYNFGIWEPLTIYNLRTATGFKTLNSGSTRVDGCETSLRMDYKKKSHKLGAILSYSYAHPTSMEPDLAYGYFGDLNKTAITYFSTSSNTEDRILKYRIRHTVRVQLDWDCKRWSISVAGRFNSFMENIDQIFIDLDAPGGVQSGITEWRAENNRGDLLLDVFISYEISKRVEMSVFVLNVMNREYMSRPLQIEPGRFTQIRFTYELE